MKYDALSTAIADTHSQAQQVAVSAVNRHLVLRNWMIGTCIVEFEEKGQDRSQQGTGLLKHLTSDLKNRNISGLGASMLKDCRTFYRLYPQIRQPVVGESFLASNRQPMIADSTENLPNPLPAATLLCFSWSHLIEPIWLDDPWKRAFYENECLKGNWSKRQLQRQIGALLYERTGLSTDKETVINKACDQAIEAHQNVADLIRDPYAFEFTGLTERPHYLENDFKTALLGQHHPLKSPKPPRNFQFAFQIIPRPRNANIVTKEPLFELPPLHPRQISGLGNTHCAGSTQLRRQPNSHFHIEGKLTVKQLNEVVWNGNVHDRIQDKDQRAEINPPEPSFARQLSMN